MAFSDLLPDEISVLLSKMDIFKTDPQINCLRTVHYDSPCSDSRLSAALDPHLLGKGFNAAITACEKAGEWEFALELLKKMTEFILESSVISPDLMV